MSLESDWTLVERRSVCGVCGLGLGGVCGLGGKEVQLRDPVLTGASHRCSRAGPSTSSPT